MTAQLVLPPWKYKTPELREQFNKVNEAKAKWIKAEQDYLITESQNFSEIETASSPIVARPEGRGLRR